MVWLAPKHQGNTTKTNKLIELMHQTAIGSSETLVRAAHPTLYPYHQVGGILLRGLGVEVLSPHVLMRDLWAAPLKDFDTQCLRVQGLAQPQHPEPEHTHRVLRVSSACACNGMAQYNHNTITIGGSCCTAQINLHVCVYRGTSSRQWSALLSRGVQSVLGIELCKCGDVLVLCISS